MPEFFKIDGLLQRCGYSASAIKQMRASSSRRLSGSSLVSRAEAIRHLTSIIESNTCRRIARSRAAKVLAELHAQPPVIPRVTTIDAQDVVEDRGCGLLRVLAKLVEVDEKNTTIRTSNDGLPVLIDLTVVLSGRSARRSTGCVRAVVRKYFRKTPHTTDDVITKKIIPGKQHSTRTPTHVPMTLRALLEFVLRIPEQLAGSPCLEAAPIIARYYGGDDGAALLDEILATSFTDSGRMSDHQAVNDSACEVGQAVDSAAVEIDDADAGYDEDALLPGDEDEDAQQPTDEEAVDDGEASREIECPNDTVTTPSSVVPTTDRRPPSCPPAPVFIYKYQGDTTTDCLYAMRLVPKTAEFKGVTLYKIGRSKDASVRRLEVSADFSETHWVSLCIVLVRAGDLELYFHRELADYRVDDLIRRRNGRALGVSREVFDLSSWASSGEEEMLVKIQKLAETAIHVHQGGQGGRGNADRLRALESNPENTSESISSISEAAPLMKRRKLTASEVHLSLEREKTLQMQAEAWRADAEARKSEAESSARKSEALVKQLEILSRLPQDVQRSLAASINVL
jgi:hypothetical protein